MTIVVTGATGKIGLPLVKGLAQAGHRVRAVTRDPAKAQELAGPNVELVQADLGDRAALERAFAGADAVFFNVSSVPESVGWHTNGIAAAKQAGVKRYVKLSAIGAALDSPVTLLRWHAETDLAVTTSGLPSWTLLQPTFFAQNYLANAATIQARGAFYGVYGTGEIAPIDARDIAAAAAAVLTGEGHHGRTYVLTGPALLSAADLAVEIGRAIGKPVAYVEITPEQLGQALLGAGLADWHAADYVTMGRGIAAGLMAEVTPALKELTGSAGRTFGEFARDHAKAFAG